MLNFTYATLALAAIMFMFADISGFNGFVIYGVMFMVVASVITIVGTSRNGS